MQNWYPAVKLMALLGPILKISLTASMTLVTNWTLISYLFPCFQIVKMGRKTSVCAVAICPSPNEASYHRFPKDAKLRAIWLNACKRLDAVNLEEGNCFTSEDSYRYERQTWNYKSENSWSTGNSLNHVAENLESPVFDCTESFWNKLFSHLQDFFLKSA